MSLILWSALAHAVPTLSATLAPDGTCTLIVQPDAAWVSAELSVNGEPAILLGPAAADAPLRVELRTDPSAVLPVSLTAVDAAGHGHTWQLEVVPQSVPLRLPPAGLVRGKPAGRRPRTGR
jgi:hypothetical protein